MENASKHNVFSQITTKNFNKFDLIVDLKNGKMRVEFDFKKHKISLADYETIFNEFESLDKKLQTKMKAGEFTPLPKINNSNNKNKQR